MARERFNSAKWTKGQLQAEYLKIKRKESTLTRSQREDVKYNYNLARREQREERHDS